jgi:hypothetical protein
MPRPQLIQIGDTIGQQLRYIEAAIPVVQRKRFPKPVYGILDPQLAPC